MTYRSGATSLGLAYGGSHSLIPAYLQRLSSLYTVLKTAIVEKVCLNSRLSESKLSEDQTALDVDPKERVTPEVEINGRDTYCCQFQSDIGEGEEAEPASDSIERVLEVG